LACVAQFLLHGFAVRDFFCRVLHMRMVYGRQSASNWPANRIVFGHLAAFNLAAQAH
jgi:hypothetical protein